MALRYLIRLHELEYGIDPTPAAERPNLDDLRSRIPQSVLGRYESAVARFGESALVELERKNVCGGCFMTQSLRRKALSEHLFQCEHCGRLVYDGTAAYHLIVRR